MKNTLLNQQRLVDIAKRNGIDAFVATSPENVTYASGYWALSQWIRRGPQVHVLLPVQNLEASRIIAPTSLLDQFVDQEDVWVRNVSRYGFFHVDRGEDQLGRSDSRLLDLFGQPDEKEAISALVKALQAEGLDKATLAIDELGLMPGHWERLQQQLPDAKLVPAMKLFREIRAVKTSQEIERLRRIATITEQSVDAALQLARPGITELEMARVFHATTVEGDATPVLGCLGFGSRSAMPNVYPSEAELRMGDVIRFDAGGRYRHYRADLARIAVLGEPSKKIRAYHKALHNGVLAAFEAIRPGVQASKVYEVAMDATRRSGIPHYSRSHVGHGIGLDGYDMPDLIPSNDQIIEEGMVMCVETPYYEFGWCGLQVENTVVVRKDGVELLHEEDGDLKVLA
ncbi:aminopeptidase P family protein [Variovorax gossypii]|uniref:Aminopeptidase P family protein n=1 Tax=Variovorax gossypii TaxID=1679495 RepID=A0A3S0HD30_9BURK|nr:Xaa-Pro peptidase family protein [Variovorax gossypii]RTQ32975.1 aminopeptidase P family protein [Variovorax gossypii]